MSAFNFLVDAIGPLIKTINTPAARRAVQEAVQSGTKPIKAVFEGLDGTQLRLPLQNVAPRGPRGTFGSPYGAAKSSPEAARNLEVIRNSVAPRAVEVPVSTPSPAATPEIPGLFSAPRPAAPVVEEATQLRLPLTGDRGRVYSYRTSPETAEAVRLGLQDSIMDAALGTTPNPAGTPSLFMEPDAWTGTIDPYRTFTNTGATTDLGSLMDAYQAPIPVWGKTFAEQVDPGTVKSIDDLAARASEYYGVPVSREDMILGRLPMEYNGFINRNADDVLESAYDNFADAARAIPTDAPAVAAPGQMGASNVVGGTRVANLSKFFPAAAAAGGVGLTGGLIYQSMQGGSQPMTPLDSPDAYTAPVVTPIAAPVLRNPKTNEVIPIPTATAGQIGSGAVPMQMNSSDSNYRQAKANAIAGVPGEPKPMSSYSKAKDYYAARQAYVSQPGVAEAVVAEVNKMMPGFEEWAKANPTLAYELIVKSANK